MNLTDVISEKNSNFEEEERKVKMLMNISEKRGVHSVMKTRKNQCNISKWEYLGKPLIDKSIKNFRIENSLLNLKKKLWFFQTQNSVIQKSSSIGK